MICRTIQCHLKRHKKSYKYSSAQRRWLNVKMCISTPLYDEDLSMDFQKHVKKNSYYLALEVSLLFTPLSTCSTNTNCSS